MRNRVKFLRERTASSRRVGKEKCTKHWLSVVSDHASHMRVLTNIDSKMDTRNPDIGVSDFLFAAKRHSLVGDTKPGQHPATSNLFATCLSEEASFNDEPYAQGEV